MKLKIDQSIFDLTGKAIATSDADPTPYTFRNAIEIAIYSEDHNQPMTVMTAEAKLKAFQIGVKLNAKKLAEYDLTIDQVAFIKTRIGIFFGPIIYGRFLELIGDEAVRKEDEEPPK